MRLHHLPKTTTKSKKRVGRGIGSGKGKTCGRGTKGQKARYKVKAGFEGGQLRFLKRIPLLRGWNFPSHQEKPEVLALERLNIFEDETQVTPDLLVEKGLTKKIRPAGVKILANGKLKRKLTLSGIQLSQSAKEQVEKLGGKVA